MEKVLVGSRSGDMAKIFRESCSRACILEPNEFRSVCMHGDCRFESVRVGISCRFIVEPHLYGRGCEVNRTPCVEVVLYACHRPWCMWLVETENAFSSRRVILYSTRPGQVERQNGRYIFVRKFHKIGHNF